MKRLKALPRRPAAWLKERKSLVKNYKQLFSLVGVFMNKKIRTDAVSHLFEAILTLENEEECFEFFEDLCTVNELLSLSQRFEVASMLKKKDTYLKIAEKTGASTATISRVNRSLNYGNDGYTMVFSRMKSYNENTNN
jgi:TrpR-related protein YerC/YecD